MKKKPRMHFHEVGCERQQLGPREFGPWRKTYKTDVYAFSVDRERALELAFEFASVAVFHPWGEKAMNDRTVNFTVSGQLLLTSDMIRLFKAPSGQTTGLRLPDGRVIKLWACFEIYEPDIDDHVELSTETAKVIGIEIIDYTEQSVTENET